MKLRFLLAASLLTSTLAFADAIAPLSSGVSCLRVGMNADGTPDLAQFNAQLQTRTEHEKDMILKSVSVSRIGVAQFLVCTTALKSDDTK